MTLQRKHHLALAEVFLAMAVIFVVKSFTDAVFLSHYGIDFVPHFFIAQSLALMGTSSLYAFIRRGDAVALLEVMILGVLIAAAAPAAQIAALGGVWVFALSLLLFASATMASVMAWNAALTVVRGREIRAFVPKVAASATLGAVLGSFGASGIVFLAGLDALGPVAAGLALVVLWLHVALRRRVLEAPSRVPSRPAAPHSPKTTAGPARRLVRLLYVCAVVEALLGSLLEFGFKNEVHAVLDRDQMGVFFSTFHGTTNLVMLLLQLFVVSKLLASNSLRFTLSIIPVSLIALSLGWVLLPTLALAALARGSEVILRYAVARPATEIAVMPLEERRRQEVKVLLRGVFIQGGGAAAGLLMVVATDWLLGHDAIVPALALVTGVVLLLLQRHVGRFYLQSLGRTLGVRQFSIASDSGEVSLDRDGLAQVLQLAAGEDPQAARFGRELLEQAVPQRSLLAAQLAHATPRPRKVLYQLLADRPEPSTLGALEAAARAEDCEADVWPVALVALAAASSPAERARARRLVGSSRPAQASRTQRAAWAYLAEIGDCWQDSAVLEQVLDLLLHSDGARAAAFANAALARSALTLESIESRTCLALDSDPERVGQQAWKVCAVLGSSRLRKRLLEGIEQNSVGAAAAVANLPGDVLPSLAEQAQQGSRSLRLRWLRALRVSSEIAVIDLAAALLQDPELRVRESAARTVLRASRRILSRGGTSAVPRKLVEAAIAAELDLLELYLRVRSTQSTAVFSGTFCSQDHPESSLAQVFFDHELERETQRSLSRTCLLIAVLGNTKEIFIAQRELLAPASDRRQQAVDILQEVVLGNCRSRLFPLLELYLKPNASIDAGLRERLAQVNPWLAQVSAGVALADLPQLCALRSSVLFAEVSGPDLSRLAAVAEEMQLAGDQVVVQEGEPGDALYVVMTGELTVLRQGQVVAQLGPGQSFGELALLDGKPRQATVRSDQPGRLLRLSREPFHAALGEQADLRLGLVRGLAGWLRISSSAGAEASADPSRA
jgi:hypothetical protein